jgi:periplasmic copper chaperone A
MNQFQLFALRELIKIHRAILMLTLSVVAGTFAFSQTASAHDMNEYNITMVMKSMFEKVDAPVTIAPISVEGDYAVAGWVQGGRGGRAFLQKFKDQWAIAVCGGSGLTQASAMQSIGMKSIAATRLASAVVLAESKLDEDRRRLLDGFKGMVKVEQAAGRGANAKHAGKSDLLQK